MGRYYRSDDFEPLLDAEQIDVVSGSKEIAKGVWVEPAPGPTAGHQIVITEGSSETYAFLGTLVPTSIHLCSRVVAAADWNPEATSRTKREVQRHAIREDWRVGPVGRDEWVCAKELESMAQWSAGILEDGAVAAPMKGRERERVAAVA